MTELARDGREVQRWNNLHPGEEQRVPYVVQALDGHERAEVLLDDRRRLAVREDDLAVARERLRERGVRLALVAPA